MTRGSWILVIVAVIFVGVASYAGVRFLMPPPAAVAPAAKGQAPAVPARRIAATLFYVDGDGQRLIPVTREVLYGPNLGQQARYLLEAQLEPAPAGMSNALPPGATVRNVFVAENGDAYIDFAAALRQEHAGGSQNEILTVYTIVHTLTHNLPGVKAVQILVDGHEVDTLAGHVDLRRPLPAAPQRLESPAVASAPQDGTLR